MIEGKQSNRRAVLCAALAVAAVATVGAAPADVGSRLQVLWDDFIVDTNLTTAPRLVHQPEYVGVAITHDAPWEGDGCGYHIIVPDRDERGVLYRMYYRGSAIGQSVPEECEYPATGLRLCYAESRDCLTWTKPELGLCAFNGSKKNNILISANQFGFELDNFFVFKDSRPGCPADELYKGLVGVSGKPTDEHFGLWCFVSADGIRWRKGWCITKDGEFDSLNTAFWDDVRQEYHCYFRHHHVLSEEDRHGNVHVRDIRHFVSKDFHEWTEPKLISFGEGAEDYPLYTNHVQPYSRTPGLYVGLPTRYVYRMKWTDTFDRLPGLANRRHRSQKNPRYGLAITDCAFMVTRDGLNFHREDDAFLDGGPEHPQSWVYGDGYLAYGLVTVPGRRPGTDPELAIFSGEGPWSGKPLKLLRYALRQDGFVSRHAPYAGARLVTRPFTFSGSELAMNFRTSARGGVIVTLREADGGRAIRSDEIVGNKIDRVVGFKDGKAADFAGKEVVLEFDMRDADLYAFQFVK